MQPNPGHINYRLTPFPVVGQVTASLLTACICLFSNSLKAESHNLDFSGRGSLEEIFKSGLKPYRQPGFEKDKCEVRDVEISIALPGGIVFPSMSFEWAEFFVYQNNLLGSAEFRTGSISLDQARALLSPFFPLAQRSSREQLETIFQKITEDPLGFEPDYSIRANNSPSWSVFLRKSYNKNKPVKIGVRLEWKRDRTERVFRETVIEPPQGYEDISMEPPGIRSQSPPPR